MIDQCTYDLWFIRPFMGYTVLPLLEHLRIATKFQLRFSTPAYLEQLAKDVSQIDSSQNKTKKLANPRRRW